MNTARNLKLCRYFTWIILSVGACTAAADGYVTDPKVEALVDPALLVEWDHINIQIWVKKGSTIGSPDTKTRVKLHINGSTVGTGGTDCDDYDHCEGTMPSKTDENLLGLYLTKKNPTCVTINWGGMWKTVCK